MKNEAISGKIATALGLDPRAAQVELYPLLGRAVVVLTEITPAVYARNRYANVETDWDIELVTPESLARIKSTARTSLAALPGMSPELAEDLVAQGVFSPDDLASVDPDELARLTAFDAARIDNLLEAAESAAVALAKPCMADTLRIPPCVCSAIRDLRVADPAFPIRFDESAGEYQIVSASGTSARMYFCHFCGGRLPSQRSEGFVTLTEADLAELNETLAGGASLAQIFERLGMPTETASRGQYPGTFIDWEVCHYFADRFPKIGVHVMQYADGSIRWLYHAKPKSQMTS